MDIEALIKNAFERDAERCRTGTPSFSGDAPVLRGPEKRCEKWRGSLVISAVIVVLISLFSIKTGIFESSWVMPRAGMVELLSENSTEVFFGILQKINSSM
ncbi:MAG: hypothetical protein LBK63_11420 [Treponema sp.]|jgi:hypothetical protein|nr:hypothetical protein [Treponema sp.]